MRICEILNPNDPDDVEIIDIKTQIWNNCKPYFRRIDFAPQSYRMYRGDRKCQDFARMKTNRYRQPKDTPLDTHKLLDRYFVQNFGFNFRSAAVFATGSEMEAREYGKTYSVFPIGDLSFCWSPKCSDLYKYLDEHKSCEHVNEILYGVDDDDDINLNSAFEYLIQMLDPLDYRMNDDLMAAIRSGNEIMINCAEYYMVNDLHFPEDWLE